MSGLNPFRPKKPEDPAGPPSSHSTSGSSYFSVPPAYTVPDTSFNPNGIPDFPSPNPTPSNDDSLSSDDQSVSDPFRQHSDLSDDEGVRRKPAQFPTSNPSNLSRELPDEEFRRTRQPGLPSAPPVSATAFGVPAGLPSRSRTHDQYPGQENARPLGENAPVASSNASIRSLTPHGGTRTTNSSVTDVSQTPAHPGIAHFPGVGRDPKPLASRSGNRDKVPPPPPKSHHGRLISPTSGTASSLSQPEPARPTNRYSFHGSPSEASLSPRPAQSEGGYFAGLGEKSQLERPGESLRRSQSQHKRPPTPPLARRHSQMRRSKTTHSKANMARLSMPPIKVDVTAESPPPSPGSWSLNPARTRDARIDTSSSDENSSQRPPLSIQTSESKSSTSVADTSASTSPSNPRASLNKRASQQNPLPPPPPPRRTRGSSNHSSDETRSTSLRSEKRAEENPAFTPEPSNARDILADLTRLQKEVDDLRGHYENRKASH
ncbi:hypothetical protein P170DRAFT_83457 [Aspergillus steynii IBT 23096]|uniref:Uncharacterized protein n=1 Tax=Aspergillus steynii IBT 23096 TaxID=1392250 RepID=A0A2I2GFT1_9EURO|nr:uncharacterized protein P170DRAFT_83457 [Aspergillus steynii IBT 23096]PLB51697.1 hypothetical protein P170DRAFT_83457 [Aspergillus steynii IBT 23096]